MRDFEIEITRKKKIACPSVPNFVRSECGETISISKLEPCELETISRIWCEKLKARRLEVLNEPKEGKA